MFAHWLFDQIVARNHIFPCTARLPRGIGQQKKGWTGEHLPLPSLSLGDAFLGSNRLGTSDTLFSCFDLSFKLGKLGLETREL